jgi:hypothetical protein
MLQQFASQNAAGDYEEGAFSLLTTQFGAENRKMLVMVQKYHGKVIREYERNYRDDSDFYAVVWDEEKEEPRHIQWATTRAWTYACGCTIDATPEVIEKYNAWCKRRDHAWSEYRKKEKKYIPAKGKTIRATTRRGKAVGKQGVVTWVGASLYGGMSARFYTDSGEATFVSTDSIEILDEETGEWLPGARHCKLGWHVPESILPTPKFFSAPA